MTGNTGTEVLIRIRHDHDKLPCTSTLPTYMHICAFSRDMAFPQGAALAKVLASENDDPERRFSPSIYLDMDS